MLAKKNLLCGYSIPEVSPDAYNCITLHVYQYVSAFRQLKIAVSQVDETRVYNSKYQLFSSHVIYFSFFLLMIGCFLKR